MPISITEHFELDEKKFENTGAFNVLLDWDTLLFVDPFLLKNVNTKEFIDSHEEMLIYFRKVLKLIITSKIKNDLAWTEAVRRLKFHEIGAFGLGFAQGGSTGSGIGSELAISLVESLKEICNLGVNDPELFELLGLFQDKFGMDRISDMICQILLERFATFTERVFSECEFKGRLIEFSIKNNTFKLPNHPFRKDSPILLVPKEILRDISIAEEGINVVEIYAKNESVRNRLNQLLGEDWKNQIDEKRKPKVYDIFRSDADFVNEVMRNYKKQTLERYDFDKDRSGEVFWRDFAKKIATNNPINFQVQQEKDLEFYIHVVRAICEKFKSNVENNGVWEVLYDEKGRYRKERISQRLFYMVSETYCELNDLDISPESNAGRGPVDFKFSHGSKNKILVEIKLSSNSSLISGFTEQTETYRISENAAKAFYLVIQVGNHDEKIQKLFIARNELASDNKPVAEIIVVDALSKLSASKLKREKHITVKK